MIKSLTKDPLLKITVVKISLLFLLLTLVLNIFHISQLDALYKEQTNLTRSMVGQLVTYYPKDEANIVNILKGHNKDLENKGKNVLNKYGYKENSILKDYKSKRIIYKSIIVFFSVSLIVLMFSLISLNILFKSLIKMIDNISDYVDNFIKNNYKVEEKLEEDGIFMSLISRIKYLGEKLDIELNKLNNEKENLKSLVTDISHQLKTPLASIGLYNSILLDDGISKEDRKKFLIQNEGSIKSYITL